MRRYVQIICSRKWIILAALITVVVVTAAITLSMKPDYRATASIYIEQKRPEGPYTSPIVSSTDIRIFLQTQLELLNSRKVAEMTLQELGLDKKSQSPAERVRLIEDLQSRIEAGSRTGVRSRPSEEALGQSNIIFVSVTDSDPVLAAMLTNAICENYQEVFFDIKGSQIVKAYNFLNDQLGILKEEMAKADEKLRNFERKQGSNLIDLSNLEKGSVEAYTDFSEFLMAQNRALVELSAAQANVEVLETQLAQPEIISISADALDRNRALVFIQEKIFELEVKLAQLKSQFTEDYKPIPQLAVQIGMLRNVLSEAKRTDLSGRLFDARMRVSLLEEKGKKLGLINNEYNKKLVGLASTRINYVQLLREQQAAVKSYMDHLSELEETRLDMYGYFNKVANVYILDKAIPPARAFQPRIVINIILAAVIGLLLGLGLAFLADTMDHTIKMVEDVDVYIDKPVLMSLPKLSRI